MNVIVQPDAYERYHEVLPIQVSLIVGETVQEQSGILNSPPEVALGPTDDPLLYTVGREYLESYLPETRHRPSSWRQGRAWRANARGVGPC